MVALLSIPFLMVTVAPTKTSGIWKPNFCPLQKGAPHLTHPGMIVVAAQSRGTPQNILSESASASDLAYLNNTTNKTWEKTPVVHIQNKRGSVQTSFIGEWQKRVTLQAVVA